MLSQYYGISYGAEKGNAPVGIAGFSPCPFSAPVARSGGDPCRMICVPEGVGIQWKPKGVTELRHP